MPFVRAAVLLIAILATLPAALAEGIEQKAALCSACHGQQGVPINTSIPVIWGQNEGYLYLQLRDFKLGNRKQPIMGAVAAGLEKQDMRDLAAYFAAKPWTNLGQPSAPADVARRAEDVSSTAACKGCHLDAWQGNSSTPHIGGQQREYLRATMAAFRDGTRANNPWMTALLKTYSDADIDAMAAYLAGQ